MFFKSNTANHDLCQDAFGSTVFCFFFAFHDAGVDSLFTRTDVIIARFARCVGCFGFSQRWRRSAVGCQARQNESTTSGQHTKHAPRHVFCVVFSSFFFVFFLVMCHLKMSLLETRLCVCTLHTSVPPERSTHKD